MHLLLFFFIMPMKINKNVFSWNSSDNQLVISCIISIYLDKISRFSFCTERKSERFPLCFSEVRGSLLVWPLVKLRGFPACGAPCESGSRLPPARRSNKKGRQTRRWPPLYSFLKWRQIAKQGAWDHSEAAETERDLRLSTCADYKVINSGKRDVILGTDRHASREDRVVHFDSAMSAQKNQKPSVIQCQLTEQLLFIPFGKLVLFLVVKPCI